jgi:ubiquitin-like 1-activating enzyme E1 A
MASMTDSTPASNVTAPLPLESHSTTSVPSSTSITEDEAALYDRQLRLWGVEAQNRIKNSNVLLCGEFRGISTEVAKNVVLAGVGKIALMDSKKVEWKDLGSGYWEREEDVGQYVRQYSP